jgi:hypothetical protein
MVIYTNMQFKTWFENNQNTNLIFCDLDETLVKTKYLVNAIDEIYDRQEYKERLKSGTLPQDPEEIANQLISQGWKIIKLNPNDWQNTWFCSYRRPGADEFLQSIQSFAEVYILTSGKTQFQTQVVQSHGFPVEKVIGKDAYGEIESIPLELRQNSILVDDLGPNTIGVRQKIDVIGIGPERHVQVHPYLGPKSREAGNLSDALTQIKGLFTG